MSTKPKSSFEIFGDIVGIIIISVGTYLPMIMSIEKLKVKVRDLENKETVEKVRVCDLKE